ncbi:MAG: glutaconyl-CoA decarboxylase subunit beta [Candidatus Cloacimonas sp. 4484_143]|nr:MAG: glutaconyl-CoA decarboxylase subunit beta [Candidatus Cloacimonas sp. 4484_143]
MAEFFSFFGTTGIAQFQFPYLIMLAIGCFFIWLGIAKDYEPLLLVPIGFGVILGNLPGTEAYGVYAPGSVMSQLYYGVKFGLYPPLIFLGIGAMTDFSTLIANPKLILLGAAAQFGIFATFIGSLLLGFNIMEAGAIGIIGGADGPTSIFLSTKLAPHLLGPIAIAAYSYMALVPVIQPPKKILFPIIGALVTILIAPGSSSLLGMLFFGNLLKESGVTERLARTASNALIDIITIVLGLGVGASTQAIRMIDGVNKGFLTSSSLKIFVLGAFSFCIATAAGVLFAKFMNLFLKEKINPMIGASGVSAVPDSARVVHTLGQKCDKGNFLLMHAMAPNVAGVIGSAVAAGVLLGILGN